MPESAPGMLPKARPPITRQIAIDLAADAGLTSARTAGAAFILGRRGYYPSMGGNATGNDRNVYDDAWALVLPDVFETFNANTDPENVKVQGRATLVAPQILLMKEVTHRAGTKNAHQALGQASPVLVHRHDTESWKAGDKHETWGVCQGNGIWRGWFGINGHCGFYNQTGSEGCQTCHPDQWSPERANPGAKGPYFWPLVKAYLDSLKAPKDLRTIQYVLTVANA